MGSYNRIVKGAGISFHPSGSKSGRKTGKRYMGTIAPNGWHGYTPPHKSEGYVELFAFTREYVERLREGDPSTELHFVTYFDQLLRIKLRARMLASETVEDLRQETYIRVLVTKQMKDRVRQVIEELPKKDRELLRAFFLEEKDKDEVCIKLGVDRDYFRVLLHRAKDKFRVLYEKDREGLSGKFPSGEET